MKRGVFTLLMVLFAVGVLFMTGCKASNPEDDAENVNSRIQFQGSAAYVSSFLNNMLWNTYNSAIALPANAVYDSGWWSFTVALDGGQTSDVQIQFQDQNHAEQKLYKPDTTFYILLKGSSAGAYGTLTFDLVMSGTQAASETLTVNGSGTANYSGLTSTYTVNNLKISKAAATYPQSGTVRVNFNQTSVTITFNGTQYATATYTFLGFSYSFTINLATGDYS